MLPHCDLKLAGGPAVAIFFVLSSFLLSLPLLRRPESDLKSLVLWRNYAIRRVLRIYPLFLVALLVFAARYWVGTRGMALSEIPGFVLGHLALVRGEHIFWAVNVECRYYFILPFVVATWSFVFRRSASRACVVFVLIGGLTFLLSPTEGPAIRCLDLTRYLTVFLMGFMCAIAHARIAATGGVQCQWTRFIMELVALCSLAVLILLIPSAWSSVVSSKFSPNDQPWHWYLWGLVSCLFLFSQLHGVGYVRSVLECKPIRAMGLISFSIYLTHSPVLWICVKTGVPLGPTGLLVAGPVILVSFCSYLIIERPFLRLGRKLCRGPSVAAVDSRTKDRDLAATAEHERCSG